MPFSIPLRGPHPGWWAGLVLLLGTSIAAAAAPGTRALIDPVGRRVEVPADPRRVVAMAPSITEIVFALGQQHRLVGVTRFSDHPPQAGRLPKVGTYVHLDIEKIVALQPDLCIAVKDGNPAAVAHRLAEMNIPVFAVDPRDLLSVMHTIRVVGDLLHSEAAADRLVQDMQARIDDVKARIARTAQRPGVFFQIGVAPIVAVGTDTFIHELIVTAGGTNLTAGDVPYPRLSREQVLELNPEIIIITSMAREGTFDRAKAEWQSWGHLPAARHNRIHLTDSNVFDRPSPRLVTGLEHLARLIHPDLFETAP